MIRASWIFTASLTAAALMLPTQAAAFPGGTAGVCAGCHYGVDADGDPLKGPIVSVQASKISNLAPGEELTFAFTVEAQWSGAVAAGFSAEFSDAALNAAHLAPVDDKTKVLDIVTSTGADGTQNESAGDFRLTHNSAQALDAERKVTFNAKVIAPAEPGVYQVNLQTVTTDSMDGVQVTGEETNDPTGSDRLYFGVGCELQELYADIDGDGFGDYRGKIGTCDPGPMEGFVSVADDCDDSEPFAFPGSTACGFEDFDCDGDFDSLSFHPDADGDGVADEIGFPMFPQTPTDCEREGFVALVAQPAREELDCDSTNPMIYPGAPEVVDGLDNDCNGVVDDVPVAPAPPDVPTPAETPPAPSVNPTPVVTPAPPVAPAPPVPVVTPAPLPTLAPAPEQPDAGCVCAVNAGDTRSQTPWGALAVLLGAAGLFARRRRD